MSKPFLLKNKCKACHEVVCRDQLRIDKKGFIKESICKKCRLSNLSKIDFKRRSYEKYKKNICDSCGFTGYSCQLDIHHKDGNHANNLVENLGTLCSNCHRLVHCKNPT